MSKLKQLRKQRRRELRHNMTAAEARLWTRLKNRQLGGRKFRRQHSAGPFILDFYCPEERLAIELDGESHNNPGRREYDRERGRQLAEHGIRVIRFENKRVFEELTFVLEAIQAEFSDNDE